MPNFTVKLDSLEDDRARSRLLDALTNGGLLSQKVTYTDDGTTIVLHVRDTDPTCFTKEGFSIKME